MELKTLRSLALAIPVVIFLIIALLVEFSFLMSVRSELYPKWVAVYSESVISKLFFAFHIVLSPGGALIVFAVFSLFVNSQKDNFIVGVVLLIYFPFHLLISYILISFGPAWIAFISVELVALIYFVRRALI